VSVIESAATDCTLVEMSFGDLGIWSANFRDPRLRRPGLRSDCLADLLCHGKERCSQMR
jgi:hypothetical protein